MSDAPRIISYGAKTALVVIVIPFLVLLFGLWQTHRTPSPADLEKDIAAIQEDIVQLRAYEAKEGSGATVKDDKGMIYSVAMAISRLQTRQSKIESSATLAVTLPTILTRVEVPLAALTVLVGALGLLYIRRLGQTAMQSRDHLLQAFSAGQKLLPWLLAAFAIGFFGSLACGVGFELSRFASTGVESKGAVKLFFVGVIFILLFVYMGAQTLWNLIKQSRNVFKHAPVEIMGRSISQEDAPRLWHFVREIAGHAQASMPDTIVAGLNECFFVTEHPVALTNGGTVPPGRVLYLPLPYMAFMDKGEVAAVIGHELGHFTGDDTRYSLHFAPIYASAVNNITAVAKAGGEDDGYWHLVNKPAIFLGGYFLHALHNAVQHWSRIRELGADQVGSVVAGKDAAISALLRVTVLAPRVHEALSDCWNSNEAGHGVLARARQLVQEKGLDDPREHLEDKLAHPTDSHPTLHQRLEALGADPREVAASHVRPSAPSALLYELGLDSASPTAQATEGAAQTAPAGASLSHALEADFSAAAQSDREKHIAFLTELAQKAETPRTVYEGGLLVVLAFFLASAGLLFGAYSAKAHNLELLGAGLLSGYIAWYFFRRRSTPVMTLSAEGILFCDLPAPMPWTAVADYSANIMNTQGGSTVTLSLELAKDYTPPPFAGKRRSSYKKKKHQIVFTLNGVQKMKPDDFIELFHDFWQGGLAREELRQYQ